MIVLDSGDKIRGDASAATVVDYTLHGLDANVLKQLADGQLAASITDIYTADSVDVVTFITLVNTDTSARTVNLYLTPSGGTARRLIPEDMTLGIGYSLCFDGRRITVLDTNGAVLSTWAVDDTPVDGETSKPISSNWAYDHAANTTTAHGAVSAATASKVVVRDGSARAKFAAPGAAGDALIKGTRIALADMAALTTDKIWKGVAGVPAESDLPVAVSSGNYTGNDSANRAIVHGLSAAPKIVFIVRASASWFRIMADEATVRYLMGFTDMGALAVTAPDATNFYVGNATSYAQSANGNTYIYYWVAIG